MKKEKSSNSKPFYKKIWFWILIIILAIGGVNALTKQQSSKNNQFKMTKSLGEDFALYFKDNAQIFDNGKKVDFIPGGDDKFVSVRLGEGWKYESISRKIYITNEFLKAKNTLFEKWAEEKDYKIDAQKADQLRHAIDASSIMVHVSKYFLLYLIVFGILTYFGQEFFPQLENLLTLVKH